jgi:hypothetical protein
MPPGALPRLEHLRMSGLSFTAVFFFSYSIEVLIRFANIEVITASTSVDVELDCI